MKRLLAMFLVPASIALAAEQKGAPAGDPMAGWVPPKVKNEAKDKQELQALFKAMEAAGKKGDLEAAAALVDFPVLMITDDSKGEALGEAWDRDRWTQVMKPMYENPPKDMKVTHKPTVFLLSDSLASIDDVCTMAMGGKTLTTRNSWLAIRRDGKWRVKAMAEGGWGDMMAAGAQGTGSGSETSGSHGSSGAAENERAPGTGTGTGTQGAPERTKK